MFNPRYISAYFAPEIKLVDSKSLQVEDRQETKFRLKYWHDFLIHVKQSNNQTNTQIPNASCSKIGSELYRLDQSLGLDYTNCVQV